MDKISYTVNTTEVRHQYIHGVGHLYGTPFGKAVEEFDHWLKTLQTEIFQEAYRLGCEETMALVAYENHGKNEWQVAPTYEWKMPR